MKILVMILLLLCSANVRAQVLGRWVPVSLGYNILPRDFAFSDSLHGVLFCDWYSTEVAFVTSDGGAHWIEKARKNLWWSKEFADMMVSPAPGIAVVSNRDGDIVFDHDSIFFRGFNDGLFEFFGQLQYSTTTSLRFGSPLPGFSDPNKAVLYQSSDGWKTNTMLGLPLECSGGYSALIIDSTEVWCNVWTGHAPITTFHTKDRAQTWQPVVLIDSALCPTCSSFNFVRGIDRNSFYLFNGLDGTDCLITHDDGVTWKRDTFFNGRVGRLSAVRSSEDKPILWALAGNCYYYTNLLNDPKNYRAYTVSSSTDEGLHWSTDSTTFAKDTLLEMHWVDERHGFIASWRDSVGYIYRFVPEGESVASEPFTTTPAIYPNPAFGQVRLINPSQAPFDYVITDQLGRALLSGSSKSAKCDVLLDRLSPGVYFIRLHSRSGNRMYKLSVE